MTITLHAIRLRPLLTSLVIGLLLLINIRSGAESHQDLAKLKTEMAKAETKRDAALEQITDLEAKIESQNAILTDLQKTVTEKEKELAARLADGNLAGKSATKDTPTPAPQSKVALPTQFLTEVTPRVVIIEGDQGNGTGFVCGSGEEAWIYTAAHVLSGNRRISVRDSAGQVYREFEFLECAEGVDLVRLKPKQADLEGLDLTTYSNAPKVGDVIVAVGNSLGTGILSGEAGRVTSIGETMWEVDAEIIPGNSGGPIISLKTGQVVGIVTHLTIHHGGVDNNPHADPDVKRFAARLDKEWEWRRVPVSRLVKEWQHIEKVSEDSSVAWAAISLMTCIGNKKPHPQRKLAEQIIAENRDHVFARRADDWIRTFRSARNSQKNSVIGDGNKLIDQIIEEIRFDEKEPEADDFSWYHRQAYEAEREFRELLTK